MSAESFWVEDRYASRCYLCNQKFGFVRRRHHCRQCGQIFCSDCLENVPVLHNTTTLIAAAGGGGSASPDGGTPLDVQREHARRHGLIGFRIAGLLRKDSEEKVCLNCAKQRRGRVAAAHGIAGSAASSFRRETRLQRANSHIDVARVTAQGDDGRGDYAVAASGRNSPSYVIGEEQEDLAASGVADGVTTFAGLSRMASIARTDDSTGSRGQSPSEGAQNRFISISNASSPKASGAAHHNKFSGQWDELPQEVLVSSNVVEPYFSPHVETDKERRISYGMQELPMVKENAMEKWLQDCIRAATKQSALRYVQPFVAPPHRKKLFLANPRAQFRTGERAAEAGLFPMAFLDVGTFEARTGILELLEARCTTHLLRRVMWLIHETNVRHELEEKVQAFHAKRFAQEQHTESVHGNSGGNGSLATPNANDEVTSPLQRASSSLMVLYSNRAGAGGRAGQKQPMSSLNSGGRPPRSGGSGGRPGVAAVASSPRGQSFQQQHFIASSDANNPPVPPLLPPAQWLEPICDISWRVVSQTLCERDPSIVDHIDILTLAGADFADTEIIPGIAFFHNVANKKMRTRIDNVRVLVLSGDIGLHMAVTETRIGGGVNLTSPTQGGTHTGGTVVVPAMEFLEYTNTYVGSLEKQYQRIQHWKPSLIVAERGVHHYLQDLITKDAASMTLLTHVGRPMLERIATGTGALVVDDLMGFAINDVLQDSPLGYCNSFHLTQLGAPATPCVMLSGLPRPTFTTVLLRGADEQTLQGAKRILFQSVVAAYHLALQAHYLVDFNAVVSQAPTHDDVFDGSATEELVVHGISALVAPHSPRNAASAMSSPPNSWHAATPTCIPSTSPDLPPPVSSRQATEVLPSVDDATRSHAIPILPVEALSLNMGITYPREVLTCCSAAAMVRRRAADVGVQHAFVRELQGMRDSIIVQHIFLEGAGLHAEGGGSGNGAATAGGGGGAGAALAAVNGAGVGTNSNFASGGGTAGIGALPPVSPHGGSGSGAENSGGFSYAGGGASQVEAAETVRKQRHSYPFYLDGDETLYEFLADRAVEARDSLQHVLHGNRRVIIRCTTQMKDVYDDVRTPFSPTIKDQPAYSNRNSMPAAGSGTRGTAGAGQPPQPPGKNIAEQLSELYLRQLAGAVRFVRVPHCYTTCKECLKNHRCPNPSTLPVPLSPHTLSMSFGAFLELSVYMSRDCISMCGHSLHQDLTRCFVLYPTEGMQVTVAFDVEPLPVFKMYGPPLQLRPLPPKLVQIAPPVGGTTHNHEGLQKGASLVLSSSSGPQDFITSNDSGLKAAPPSLTESATGAASPVAPAVTTRSPLEPRSPARPMGQSPTTAHGTTPGAKSLSFLCSNARELYFAYELQELSRNLYETKSFHMKRNRAADVNSPSPFATQLSRGSPDATLARFDQLIQEFYELRTVEDVVRYRVQSMYPFIDDLILDRGCGSSAASGGAGTSGPTAASNADGNNNNNTRKSAAPAISPADSLALQGMRNQQWAYLPNEKLSIRVGEPTSIIAAVLQAMQSCTTTSPLTQSAGAHGRSHTRTFSIGAGMDEAPTGALQHPRPSRVAHYLHQFSSAVFSNPAGAPGGGAAGVARAGKAPQSIATTKLALSDATPSPPDFAARTVAGASASAALADDGEANSMPRFSDGRLPSTDNMGGSNQCLPMPDVTAADAAVDEPMINSPGTTSLGDAAIPQSSSTPLFLEAMGESRRTPDGDVKGCAEVRGTERCDSVGREFPAIPTDDNGAAERESSAVTPSLLTSDECAGLCAAPSLCIDGPEATTIEQVLQEVRPNQSGAQATPTVDAVGRPQHGAGVDGEATFVRDQFRKEDEAIDVLSGKAAMAASGSASYLQTSSFKYVFRDIVMPMEAAKPSTIVVEVMYPHQFAAMRYLYARDLFTQQGGGVGASAAGPSAATEDGIIASLLRCQLFNAQGGRSGAGFFITQDERLMLKKIKLTELRHFTQFAPQYFEHMVHLFMHVQHLKRQRVGVGADGCPAADGSSFAEDEQELHAHDESVPHATALSSSLGDYSSFSADDVPPSALSKIFGVFSISFKRGRGLGFGSANEVRYYMLTENIMYRRPVETAYDLKGSQLNRHAAEGSHVLLDQDLVHETKKGFFFYCRESNRTRVIEALTNDAQRLCAASIMDYSTIVSVDRRSESLAFGVVDYLHPYTGAKVIESKVKGSIENMFGKGLDPTIIDPQHYKQRFVRWMDSYLCAVPDKLASLKKKAITASSHEADGGGGDTAIPPTLATGEANSTRKQTSRVVRMLSTGASVLVDDVEYRVV